MGNTSLTGIVVPVVTPLVEGEYVDVSALGAEVDRLVAAGVHGIFVLGSTGEFPALREGEKERAIRAAVEAAGGRVPVLAGATEPGTERAVAWAKAAAQLGADAVVVAPPYYYRMDRRALLRHFSAVAKASPIPLVLYNYPQTTGNVIDVETVSELAHAALVIGIKDSGGDLIYLQSLTSRMPESCTRLIGHEGLAAAALLCGYATGVVPAMAAVVPELFVSLWEAYRRSDVQAVRRLQAEIDRWIALYSLGPVPVVVKACLWLLGRLQSPLATLPLGQLDVQLVERLREWLDSHGLPVREREEVERWFGTLSTYTRTWE
ncbi:dihydrodipicolinate synthase family protein [Geochorda subterranea]|uniref:Dihydrodipicolinate synthase family protein n=1 Tax=Geochorda subterranea TaxID=3109564 RepID=A0ABZ1BMA3_9FIRM|nr:dihydrodipicolinate synthase family protein [Limnochorda sp. LNt]WRP13655.1 dihydrodipicolinate synthase family protein [Limnochorda sp. LNt]